MARILQYHREIEHHVVKKEVCTICGKAAKRIKEHMKRFHVKEKNIQCDKCDYRLGGPTVFEDLTDSPKNQHVI